MRQARVKLGLAALLLLTAGLACRLVSPTPASWSGTPSAEAREATNAAFERTQQARLGEETIASPTASPTPDLPTVTPGPTVAVDGPWLVFPESDGSHLYAYDVEAQVTLEVALPVPVVMGDLLTGLSPDGHTLILRAGSPLNTDELALYQIDLPSLEILKRTPLLSITEQRKLVNEVGTRAFDTLRAITRGDSLAWSPDGRFLAFTAALSHNSADLYVLDLEKGRVDRLNGLYSQSASPFWAPGSNWLITQELDGYTDETGWRSEAVSGLRVPGYDSQNTLYLPVTGSQGEVFLGWTNAQNFISYSLTAEGPTMLRQVNVETQSSSLILAHPFRQVAFDPESRVLAFSLDETQAAAQGLIAGVYLLRPERAVYELQQAGNWQGLDWDPGGLFVASGVQGVFAFTPEGDSISLPDESWSRLSPSGNWLIAWGDGAETSAGARLYQSPSGNRLQEITDMQVESILWQPDSKAFFMLAEGRLYRLAFPSLNLEEIAAGFPEGRPLEMIWVE